MPEYLTKYLILILGPTGVGKTKLSLQIANCLTQRGYHPYILSADSIQIYKGVDILSAKATAQERESVKHELIDIVDVTVDDFSVNDFQTMAHKVMADYTAQHGDLAVPIIVGGTNLYIEATVFPDRYFFIEGKGASTTDDTDNECSDSLRETLNNLSNSELYERLRSVDEERALQLHPNDRRKVLRSLLVFYSTGKKHSDILKALQSPPTSQSQSSSSALYTGRVSKTMCVFWLTCEKDTLKSRLEQRIDDMVNQGLVGELRWLHRKFKEASRKMEFTKGVCQSIGLKEFAPLLELMDKEDCGSAITEEEFNRTLEMCLAQVKINTRRYAKKQILWITNHFIPQLRSYAAPGFIPVYSLDTTEVAAWDGDVRAPAEFVVSELLIGYTHEYIISNLETNVQYKDKIKLRGLPDEPLVKKDHTTPQHCTLCNKVVRGEVEWQQHLRSKQHKMKSRKQKRQTNKMQETSAPDVGSTADVDGNEHYDLFGDEY